MKKLLLIVAAALVAFACTKKIGGPDTSSSEDVAHVVEDASVGEDVVVMDAVVIDVPALIDGSRPD